MTRKATNQLLEMVEEGVLDRTPSSSPVSTTCPRTMSRTCAA